MQPQILLPGLWVYHLDGNDPFYIGGTNNITAQLLRKTVDGKYTDSVYKLFSRLTGIRLDYDILIESFGFLPSAREGYVFKQIYKELTVLRGDNRELVKAATNLVIEMEPGTTGKRFTTYLECGDSRIFLSEISHVHELQILIFAHTYNFPYIIVNKTKQDEQNV
jgi:hypothetical protein